MEILEKTFKEMPRVFTSNEFNDAAVTNGYPKELLKNGLARFLHKYATNGKINVKTWTKKKHRAFPGENIDPEYKFKSIEDIIKFLKSNNYKVMKPVSEWVEC